MSDALKERIIELLPRLRRFAHALTGSRDQGDDLVQDTVERVLVRGGVRLDHEEPGRRLDSLMFKVAQNLWIDRYRSLRARGEHIEIDAAPETVGVDGRSITESRLTLDAVGRGIGRLPDELRVLVVLVCIEGATYEEAAATLGIPIGTVMSRLARARRQLHAALSETTLPPATATHVMEAARGRTH